MCVRRVQQSTEFVLGFILFPGRAVKLTKPVLTDPFLFSRALKSHSLNVLGPVQINLS